MTKIKILSLKMARHMYTEDMEFQRIPILLNDLLIRDNVVQKSNNTCEIFQDILHFSSRQNNRDMLPVLITAEERDEIKRDQQKAIEYEEKVAKRKQEKHFDLVDQVQHVLKRIEENNSRNNGVPKDATCKISEKTSPLSVSSLESSDRNNNPFFQNPEVYFDKNSESDLNHNMTRQGFPGHQTTKQNAGYGREERSGRFSLPADFMPGEYFVNNDSYTESITRHSQGKMNRPASVFSDHPSLYSTSLPFSDTSSLRHTPATQIKTSSRISTNDRESQAWTSVSPVTETPVPVSLSKNDHSTITKQREMLALEEKRLEEHFSAMQGKLMAEFQQQQKELLQSYKESIEHESAAENCSRSEIEPTFSNNHHNSSNKENYKLIETDEFPQSPFSLSPRRKSSSGRKPLPGVSVTVRSFNSEASAQEFYEIPRFLEKKVDNNERKRINSRVEATVDSKRQVRRLTRSPTDEKKPGQGFDVELCTSPKLKKLNSFEPKTNQMKNTSQTHKFMVLSAYAKGFLTRCLFRTEKVNSFVTTVKDAKIVLNEMKSETSQSITDRSFKARVEVQLQCAQDELRKVFLDSSPHLRMHILEQNRRLLKEKQDRNNSKVIANAASQSRPKLSSVTVKKRMSRQERDMKKLSKTTSTTSTSTAVKTTVVSKETPSPKRVEKLNVQKHSSVPRTTTGEATAGHVTTTSVSRTQVRKAVNTSTSNKVTKTNNNSKVVPAQTKRRRTWDNAILKPIQGRISPTLPNNTKSFGTRKKSSMASTKGNHKSDGTQGTSGTDGKTRVDSEPCKLSNKQPPVTRPGAKRSLAAKLSMK